MAKLRAIPFGYAMQDGKIIINPADAETVVRIFSEYISGKGLEELAKILNTTIFYKENVKWYPDTVRIILNEKKYLGTEQYPALISKEMYQKAARLKTEKNRNFFIISEELNELRKMLFCKECGQKLFPGGVNAGFNSWGCNWHKCRRKNKKVTAQALTDAILEIMNAVIENPFLLNTDEEPVRYSPDTEIIRQQNEIRRMTENSKTDCERIKSELLQLAEMKYNCCTYSNIPQKTEFLKKLLADREQLHTLDIGLLKSCVKRMTVSHSAVIEIEFINGMKFSKSIERTESDEHST